MGARTYHPDTGRFTSTDPQPTSMGAVSPYAYASNNPLVYTDPTGAMPVADGGGGTASSATAPNQEVPAGPSPEDVAKAQQLQSKSVLDVVLEAGGQVLMEVLGINDVLNCLKGELGACVMAVVGSLPWGKIFKAKKIAEAICRAGKAVITFFKELDWAKAILRGAGKGTITATTHHPFWSATRDRWVEAGELRHGELLRTAAGSYVQVSAVDRYQGIQRTYDLTVDDLHSYYVIAGDEPVLVHNCGKPVLLGWKADIEDYISVKGSGGFDADFLNIRGTMAGSKKGVSGWNWTRTKRFVDDALDNGTEIRLVTDPNVPSYRGGNVYKRELKYLLGKGYGWEQVDDCWRVIRVRP